jgi:hypothetical protein
LGSAQPLQVLLLLDGGRQGGNGVGVGHEGNGPKVHIGTKAAYLRANCVTLASAGRPGAAPRRALAKP